MKAKYFIENNFHALCHKDFRYYWSGQCISLVGTWMQSVSQSWLVLSLTKSPTLLGLLGTVQFLPVMLFSLFAGPLVDKFPKKKTLIFTQTIFMLLAFVLAFLTLTNKIKYYEILVLALILGFINTIDMPTRQAYAIEIVGKEDLMNAIALNSATFNLARVVGPAIGGLMMAYIGAGYCFLINGISYIAVIFGLFMIKAPSYVRKKNKNVSVLKETGEGLKYIKKNPILIETLFMVLVVGIFVFNFNVLIPVFTKNVLHKGETAYGYLLSALGAGSLLGAISVSLRSKKGPKKKTMVKAVLAISVFLMLISFTKQYYLAIIILFFTGIFNIYFSTTANSTLQINSKDEYRGRVLSVYTLVFAGATPFGNMFAGLTSSKFGGDVSFFLSGFITLILISLFLLLTKYKNNNSNYADAK